MLKSHYDATQQQRLNRLSDIHKILYGSFFIQNIVYQALFFEKSGSDNTLLYGTYKCQSVLSVFLGSSR